MWRCGCRSVVCGGVGVGVWYVWRCRCRSVVCGGVGVGVWCVGMNIVRVQQ